MASELRVDVAVPVVLESAWAQVRSGQPAATLPTYRGSDQLRDVSPVLRPAPSGAHLPQIVRIAR